MPTGNYKAEDIYNYKLGTNTLTRKGPVDQSIQLGDGGWGLTLELNAFRQLNNAFSAYGNAYYLINPKGNNGVSTARGGIASATAIKYTFRCNECARPIFIKSRYELDNQCLYPFNGCTI